MEQNVGKHRVAVLGQNLCTVVDGVTQRHGFFTSVFVEADSPEHAGTLAVSLLQADPKLVGMAQNPADDPFRLVIEETHEIGSFAGVKVPRTGLALFPEQDDVACQQRQARTAS
jgi:hypothetical protein